MGHWADTAAGVIAQVHEALPQTATYEERRKALSAAYPFGQRKYAPYKTWLQACNKYLARYASPGSKKMPLSPLERMMARGRRPHDQQ